MQRNLDSRFNSLIVWNKREEDLKKVKSKPMAFLDGWLSQWLVVSLVGQRRSLAEVGASDGQSADQG